VRAAMVTGPADYPWSSYPCNGLGTTGPNQDWLTPHPEYQHLGATDESRQQAYRALFEGAVGDADLQKIRNAVHTSWALGNERFKQEIETLTQRRTQPKARGRPQNRV
jgi:putative transposase